MSMLDSSSVLLRLSFDIRSDGWPLPPLYRYLEHQWSPLKILRSECVPFPNGSKCLVIVVFESHQSTLKEKIRQVPVESFGAPDGDEFSLIAVRIEQTDSATEMSASLTSLDFSTMLAKQYRKRKHPNQSSEAITNGKRCFGRKSQTPLFATPKQQIDSDAEKYYCICRRKATEDASFMIACDQCGELYHASCVQIDPEVANDIELYYCSFCTNQNPALQTVFVRPDAPKCKFDERNSSFVALETRSMNELCYACAKIVPHSALIKCSFDSCNQYLHPECVRSHWTLVQILSEDPLSFSCEACFTNRKICTICASLDEASEMLRCEHRECGRFFHGDCLRKCAYKFANLDENEEVSLLACPAHFCVTCSANSPPSVLCTEQLLHCVFCPSSFHASDYCLPAGAVVINAREVICCNHWRPEHASQDLGQKHQNVSFCHLCASGGDLIGCKTCPNAFHSKCLPALIENMFTCEECFRGKKPLFGDVVWVKVRTYPWWPAEVVHPLAVEKRDSLSHQPAEFVVRFFGPKKSIAYTTSSRCLPFRGKNDRLCEQRGRRHHRAFKQALVQANEVLAERKRDVEENRRLRIEKLRSVDRECCRDGF